MRNARNKLVVTCILFLCALCLTSCTVNELPTVKHNDCDLWKVKLENANPEFVTDYIYLWDVLENEYPMLSVAERITGKDAQEIKEKYYYEIPKYSTAQDFSYFIVNRCLNEFEGTGHLSVISQQLYEDLYVAYNTDPGYTAAHPYSQYNYSQLNTKEALSFYLCAVENAKLRLSESTEVTKETGVDTNNISDNLSFAYYPEQSTGYVNVNMMEYYPAQDIDNNPEYKVLTEFFGRLEEEGYKNCIIDIRNNPGGSDAYWKYELVAPNITKAMNCESLALIKGNVCQYYVEKLAGCPICPISKLGIEKLSALNPEDLQGVVSYAVNRREVNLSIEGRPLFSGKIWLLVSETSYSSSESFAMFCKQTGFATLVGTNTGGDGGGMDPIIFALPNTGILIRLSAEMSLNPDGSCNEEFGTTPDYPISENEDALGKCLEIIAQK